MLSMCLFFCFVVFWILCCVLCEKNKIKLLITKKKKECIKDIETLRRYFFTFFFFFTKILLGKQNPFFLLLGMHKN